MKKMRSVLDKIHINDAKILTIFIIWWWTRLTCHLIASVGKCLKVTDLYFVNCKKAEDMSKVFSNLLMSGILAFIRIFVNTNISTLGPESLHSIPDTEKASKADKQELKWPTYKASLNSIFLLNVLAYLNW